MKPKGSFAPTVAELVGDAPINRLVCGDASVVSPMLELVGGARSGVWRNGLAVGGTEPGLIEAEGPELLYVSCEVGLGPMER